MFIYASFFAAVADFCMGKLECRYIDKDTSTTAILAVTALEAEIVFEHLRAKERILGAGGGS